MDEGDLILEGGAEPAWPGVAVDLLDGVNVDGGDGEGVGADEEGPAEERRDGGDGDPGEEDMEAEGTEEEVVG